VLLVVELCERLHARTKRETQETQEETRGVTPHPTTPGDRGIPCCEKRGVTQSQRPCGQLRCR
jgi:hypothetical protein